MEITEQEAAQFTERMIAQGVRVRKLIEDAYPDGVPPELSYALAALAAIDNFNAGVPRDMFDAIVDDYWSKPVGPVFRRAPRHAWSAENRMPLREAAQAVYEEVIQYMRGKYPKAEMHTALGLLIAAITTLQTGGVALAKIYAYVDDIHLNWRRLPLVTHAANKEMS